MIVLFSIGIFFSCFTIAISYLFRKYYPKEINNLYGYRTKASMRSPEMWHIANRYSASLLLKFSMGTIPIMLLSAFFIDSKVALISTVAYWMMMLIVVIIVTERELKAHASRH